MPRIADIVIVGETTIVQASPLEQPDLFPRVRTLENQLERVNKQLALAQEEIKKQREENEELRTTNKGLNVDLETAMKCIELSEEHQRQGRELCKVYKQILVEEAELGYISSNNGFNPQHIKGTKNKWTIHCDHHYIATSKKGEIKNCGEIQQHIAELQNDLTEALNSGLQLAKIHEKTCKKVKIQEGVIKHLKSGAEEQHEYVKKLEKRCEELNYDKWHLGETISVAVNQRLATWFPEELMEGIEVAEDANMSKVKGDDLVKMIDSYTEYCLNKQ